MMEVGATIERTWLVSDGHLASAFGSGLVDVLATPVLVGFCEETCRSLVDPHLPDGRRTVGTSVTLQHTAATPFGFEVTVRATLTAVDDRRLTFQVECRDEAEPVGRGTHTRFVIDVDRFEAAIAAKAARHP